MNPKHQMSDGLQFPTTLTTDMVLPSNELRSFPTTPVRIEGDKSDFTPRGSDNIPTSTPTLRQRRGRITDVEYTPFRPLSIFTKSVLVPFELDTEKAFDVLKSDSPERLQEAKDALTDRAEAQTSPEDIQLCKTPQVLEAQKLESSFEMDLITALQITSPTRDNSPGVHDDFATLCDLPIPELSQHPTWDTNPFDIRTEAPLLFTSTSIDEIRLLNYKNKVTKESSLRSGRETIERKKSFFGLEIKTPASGRNKNALSTGSGPSPSPINISLPDTANLSAPVRSSFPLNMEYTTPREGHSSNSTSSSVRKFSDLFRRKDSLERNLDVSCWSPRSSEDSPDLDRHDLEKFLRRTTNTPTYDYDPYSHYPRHPNTGRGWRSRNLKCTTCVDKSCAVCHRVCCAYRAAVLASQSHDNGSPAKTLANRKIQEITKLFPYGREAPTFLQCTPDIKEEDIGCGKLVCPDCCSICPDELCADTLCRRCKPAMWKDCDWHKGDGLMLDCQM